MGTSRRTKTRKTQREVERLGREAGCKVAGAYGGFLASPSVVLAVLAVVVVGCVLSVYWPVLSVQARWVDDKQYMHENPLVQHPSWTSAGVFFSEVFEPSTVRGYYQPLAMISLMLDCARGGSPKNLRPFHHTSLVLHLANTLLVMALLHLIWDQPWVAAIGGLLFGLHPLNVESVAMIPERKTLLSAFFALWCLILYVRYTRGSSWLCYAMCLVMYMLALMSKPTSTTLPVVLLLLDYWPLRRLSKRCLVEKIPLFVIGAVFAIITMISQGQTGGVTMPAEHSPVRVPLILCHNIVFYLVKVVWPGHLSAYYPFPDPFVWSAPRVLASMVGSCVLIPTLLVSLRWTRALLTGWLIFFVAIFPTIGVIGFTIVIAADKYVYLPAIGLLLVLAWGLKWWWDRSVGTARRSGWRMGMFVVVGVLAVSESRATRGYLAHWQDPEDFYQYVVRHAPHAPLVHTCLGDYYYDVRNMPESIKYYSNALKLDPNFPRAHNGLGMALTEVRQWGEAIKHFERALALKPNMADAHHNWGMALTRQGKFDEAIAQHRKALAIKPNSFRAYNGLGAAYGEAGKMDEAIKYFREALRRNPYSAQTYHNLGIAHLHQGQLDEAAWAFGESLRLRPDEPTTLAHFGDVLLRQGRIEEAMTRYRQALKINPKHAMAARGMKEAQARQAPTGSP